MSISIYFRSHTNKYIENIINDLKYHLEKNSDKIKIIENVISSDIQIVQIYEMNDLIYIENGNIILYFHFKPIESEIVYLNDIFKFIFINPFNCKVGKFI